MFAEFLSVYIREHVVVIFFLCVCVCACVCVCVLVRSEACQQVGKYTDTHTHTHTHTRRKKNYLYTFIFISSNTRRIIHQVQEQETRWIYLTLNMNYIAYINAIKEYNTIYHLYLQLYSDKFLPDFTYEEKERKIDFQVFSIKLFTFYILKRIS